MVNNLLWFLKEKGHAVCGTLELRQCLAYVTNGHQEPGGRWGNPQEVRPVRPRTVKDYHGNLRSLFRWIVSEEGLSKSPMERIPVPTARPDQIQPFTSDQLQALLAAARRSTLARRNEAIIWFLLDTGGGRASELCALTSRDVDFQGRRCVVLGKGNRHRTISFGGTAARALWSYLKDEPHEPEEALFLSERGDALTRSGHRGFLHSCGGIAVIAVLSIPVAFWRLQASTHPRWKQLPRESGSKSHSPSFRPLIRAP